VGIVYEVFLVELVFLSGVEAVVYKGFCPCILRRWVGAGGDMTPLVRRFADRVGSPGVPSFFLAARMPRKNWGKARSTRVIRDCRVAFCGRWW